MGCVMREPSEQQDGKHGQQCQPECAAQQDAPVQSTQAGDLVFWRRTVISLPRSSVGPIRIGRARCFSGRWRHSYHGTQP